MGWNVIGFKLLLALPALFLAACDALPEATQAWKTAELAFQGRPDAPITRSQIEASPYASVRAKMGSSGRVVMVLGRYDAPDLHWISADRVAIATRNGRIVKTAGLSENLKNTDFLGPDPVADGLHQLVGTTTVRRLIDIDAGNHFGVPVTSQLTPQGRETIEVLERTYETIVVRETNVAKILDWEFENYYWVDPDTGFVWKSLQHATPNTPPVELEVLKPAA